MDSSRDGNAVLTPPLAQSWGAEELAATLDAVATGIWVVDLEGRCIFVNRAVCRIFGYSREECQGRRLQCILHRRNVEGWNCPIEKCRIQKTLQRGASSGPEDEVFLKRDGSPLPVRCSVEPFIVRGSTRGAVISIADITKEKSAEESLRKSNEWLDFAQQAAGVGIFDLDLTTGEAKASEGQVRLYGLDPATKWPSHEEWRMLVHPEDRERLDRDHELTLSGAQPSGREYRIVRPDGSIRWLFAQPRAFFDQAGKATRLVGADVDITGRVHAEIALNQFFHASPTPLAIWDREGHIQRVNPAWAPLLGRTAAEVEGLSLFELVHPEDRAAAAAEFERLLSSEKRTGFECRTKCKDGSYRWLLVNACAPKGTQVIYATAHDITQRKNAEEALRRSEERFRSAFENTLFGMAITGLDGQFLQVNQSLCRITGLSEEELLRTDVSAITHPGDVQESREFMRGLATGGNSRGTLDKRYLRKNRDPVWARCHVALERDPQGNPLYFIAVVEDLTEQKRAEENAHASEEWRKFTLNSAGIGLRHRDSEEVKVSDQQFRLYGLEPAAKWISRERWLQLIHPQDRERVVMEQRNALALADPSDLEFRVVWPDGSIHWLLSRERALHDARGAQNIEVTIDVTERKHAELALDEFFRLSHSPKAIFGVDGVIKRFNPALLEMSGFTAEEFAQRPVMEFFHPDDRAAMQAEIQKLAAHGGHTEFECRGLRKDGSTVWLLFTATAVPDEKLIFTIAYDITERKRAMEDLLFRNVLLSTQQEASIDGILVVDENTHILSYNRRFIEMWGIPPDFLKDGLDEGLLRFVTAQLLDPPLFLQKVQYLYEHRQESSRDELVLADGRIFDRYSTSMFGPEERYYGRIWYFRDITERKRAEAALRESEQRFKLIAETIQDVFWMTDVGFHKLLYVSPAYEGLWGRSRDDLYANPGTFTDSIHPEDRAEVMELYKFQRQGLRYSHEYRITRPDGSIAWVWDQGFPIRDDSGQIVLYTGVAKDITERKRMEEAVRVHSEKLARSNQELERFAYVASHDLQEPLRMVASFTTLLSQRYTGRLDETADKYIHYAVDGAKRMQQLIADLLAFSRVNSKELDLRPTGCEALIVAAMQNLRATIEESGATIDLDPLPEVCVDQGQFIQLFQNLLGNAIKFRQKETSPRIHVSAVNAGAEWLFSVHDNGIGIEPKHAERVFQIFQRLHTRTEYPGTGIGLAVCQKVVERHGGRIWVESQAGMGSTFRFTLPKSQTGGRIRRAEQAAPDQGQDSAGSISKHAPQRSDDHTGQ